MREEVDRHNPDIDVLSQIHRLASDFRTEAPRPNPEVAVKIAKPLLDQVRGHYDHGLAWNKPTTLPLSEVHTGHDRLACSGLVRAEEAESRLREHLPENRVVLVRVRPKGLGGKHSGTNPRCGMPHPTGPEGSQNAIRLSLSVVSWNPEPV